MTKKELREFSAKVIRTCENLKKAMDSLMDEAAQQKAADWGLINSSMCDASALIKESTEILKE